MILTLRHTNLFKFYDKTGYQFITIILQFSNLKLDFIATIKIFVSYI